MRSMMFSLVACTVLSAAANAGEAEDVGLKFTSSADGVHVSLKH